MSKRATHLIVLATALTLPAGAGAQNVALGAPVTPDGTFGVDPGAWCCSVLAPPATLTDGVFLPENDQWNVGTVWWNTVTSPTASLTVDLGGPRSVFRLLLQADNNDDYLVEYRASAADPWLPAWVSPAEPGFGMQTRTVDLGAPILASEFRITAGGAGDEYRSVSEFQAMQVVPEPATVLLLGSGLAALGLLGRRRLRARPTER